jgi:hypothetical protein
MVSLVKGFIDDDDLNSKLRALYQVEGAASGATIRSVGGLGGGVGGEVGRGGVCGGVGACKSGEN